MLPSLPAVITIVLGGAGRMKCKVIHTTTISNSTKGPYVSARSRHETCEILKRGMKVFGTLAALAVGSPTRARTWDLRINRNLRALPRLREAPRYTDALDFARLETS